MTTKLRLPVRRQPTRERRLAGALSGLALCAGLHASGVSVPLDFVQTATPYNYQAPRGVPLSSVTNLPPGSDGRAPAPGVPNESGTLNLVTSNQFQGFIAFGGLAARSDWVTVSNSPLLQGSNAFSADVAEAMQLPRLYSGGALAMVLRRAQVGAPYMTRKIDFAFGSEIPVPETNESGALLTNMVKETYWIDEPYSTNAHANAGYYWSPHARKVFLIQAGPLQITWRRLTPYNLGSVPTNYANPFGPSFTTNGNSVYLLYTVNYIGSGSAVKTPRKMYWTEREFRHNGGPIWVPAGRVGAVNVVYNNNFPRTVADEYQGPGHTRITTNETLPELRTLWYDQTIGGISAYNQEGRVFVELLGDANPDGQTRQHLGFEIVDAMKQPIPSDFTVELGERIAPPPVDPERELFSDPLTVLGETFHYSHAIPGSDRVELYAMKETVNQNDCLIRWMEEGVAGLRWPAVVGRYALRWPADAAKYSHYIRPRVNTEAEAKATAIALPSVNMPMIAYQDPLDRPRAKITDTLTFYTFLTPQYPAHRALLRYSSGDNIAFERVFSWLDTNLRTTQTATSDAERVAAWAGTVAAELSAWNGTNGVFAWPAPLMSPRVLAQTVAVGDRIAPPPDEPGAATYLVGHINPAAGTSYHPAAYIDPIAEGFDEANLGAIIPVNAVPGRNLLEVWWFRVNSAAAGVNAGNGEAGFHPVLWPSVLGRYTLVWPASPREIVLASNQGSGALDPFGAAGSIYRQNNPALAGYNPNEEHAVMSGGRAYATRDDLNVTTDAGYSSHPFVLVDYTAHDGRPAMSVFKVLREKPETGHVFDYVATAGQRLQAPMPLPLLSKPVEGSGDNALSYNTETSLPGGDLPVGWNAGMATNTLYGHYARFTYTDRHQDLWVYRGPHAGLPPLQVGSYATNTGAFRPCTNATAVIGQAFSCTLHASRQDEYLTMSAISALPAWLSLNGLTLNGMPLAGAEGTNLLTLAIEDNYDRSRVTNALVLVVRTNGATVTQAPLAMVCTNAYTGTTVVFADRPPFLAATPTPSNSFAMRYYYKTEPTFDWPNTNSPPAAGSIVPYLRPTGPEGFVGNAASRLTESLSIVYRPVWPERDPRDSAEPLPTLPYGATLTKARFNLPAARDMKTARVLYQQSVARCITNPSASVVLHDATRSKISDLATNGLTELPASIAKDYYQGKWYFPNLPPHLAARVFLDPTRGSKGALVLQGLFVNEALGESYVLLNVLRGSDLDAVKALCPSADTANKTKWDATVAGLATDIETFHENPDVPGTYAPDTALTRSAGVSDLAVIDGDNIAVDSYALSATGPGGGYVTLVESGGSAFTRAGDPVALHVFRVDASALYPGEVKVIVSANPLSEQLTLQHTADLAGRCDEFEYEWKIAAPVDGLPPLSSQYYALAHGTNMPRRVLGGAGIQALCDNYIVMRYRPALSTHPLYNQWSDWTAPKLAEGWIKRVLAGINPFNQRVTDLFNNPVNTTASLLTQAGRRWEGDIALNMDTMDEYGLIEIYETVLRRGRQLSIESGYNYGPANDALLLAAGYLNDLYMMLGGEAWADAANPTIGIGTDDATYGDIATSLFAFKGQMASLLEEELALLRGRDDFLMPGVRVAPVYNRLVWNYTRGIDAGEVIYALNYNIQEDPDKDPDGVIDAADAAVMFPQGHGDAYGHYLTALKGYYSLLLNSCFDWVPRAEAVNVLGQPVSVDYLDERKFAAAAVAAARAGRQILDLTFRKDYQQVAAAGWAHFDVTRSNATDGVERFWGMDHWACRAGQGAYLNWVVGNAILPDVDTDPAHEGIRKIDRTTVPELQELATLLAGIQTALDNAEGGLNPLGLPEGGLALDINPNVVVGTDNGTHFEQIYQRAKTALNNAVASFDDAKDVTRLMRSEQDSLTEFQNSVALQELAYRNELIEVYGTPYADDIGPGKTWAAGYDGPDLIHYAYVNVPEQDFGGATEINPSGTFTIDVQQLPSNWVARVCAWDDATARNMNWVNTTNAIAFEWGAHGFFGKPKTWAGQRRSPGKIQQAISDLVKAHDSVTAALGTAQAAKDDLMNAVLVFKTSQQTRDTINGINLGLTIADEVMAWATAANEVWDKIDEGLQATIDSATETFVEAVPKSVIAGVAAGGDVTSPARAAIKTTGDSLKLPLTWIGVIRFGIFKAIETANTTARRWAEFAIAGMERDQATKEALIALGAQAAALGDHYALINRRLREHDDARARYLALVAEGDRIQEERYIFRQRASAMIHGYRTRDTAFRLFRNEKLERYKTLFDLAARYAVLAANAYDYETGLLGTSAGRSFIGRMVSARALGVVLNGEPQYAGSDTGDPGLSSALAEMKADWDVLRGRLGFNNPDAYGTTVSLRSEALRILPSSDGDTKWRETLQRARQQNILDDADVRRYCMQIDPGDGLPVPGIVLTFSTTIAAGYNLFGLDLAAGDHAFSPSAFATKIFGVGTAFIGYRGMDNPAANSGAGGTSPADPDAWFLDPLALSATPYIYLIPVGMDSMRSPPLGDASAIRTWSVADLAIPMPFNIGASDFSTRQLWQSSDSLTEPLFTERKHQAFRPVSTASVFSPDLYGDSGSLLRSQFTNNRLVGRSVWNSRWKLVIPGKTLLSNANDGLDRFVQTVTDIKLHFVTYSYSGN